MTWHRSVLKRGFPTPSAGLPEQCGRYTLLKRIGRGGMADVFMASVRERDGQERRCVVKRIRADREQSIALAQMIATEARITKALRHPCIVEVFEHGTADDAYFIAMEYLEGHDLGSVMYALDEKSRLMPVPCAAFVAHEVAEGLAYAHQLTDPSGNPLGLVHRDISPANIMLLSDGGVKILDFGLAKLTRLISETRTIPGR